jgi:hypothetical protein
MCFVVVVSYVDRPESGTVAGSHVLVEGVDSLGTRHLTVLLVHVVGTGARVVTDPDTKVLDLGGPLLMDLSQHPSVSSSAQMTILRFYTPH